MTVSIRGPERTAAQSYPVETEKVREFAAAIGDDAPIRHDPAVARAAGYPGVVAPPTFSMVVLRPHIEAVATAELGIDPETDAVLHTGQRFVYHRPICAGERVDCAVTIENRRDTTAPDGARVTKLDLCSRLSVAGELRITVYTAMMVQFGTVGRNGASS
ncbi:FAS1-like dehydratase domain-containing protein [Nocardia terpenica]|uniref:FAS1-like dehydratase domain-containing protein n=1 Tax=Nocardia terpenica TaxID=455432 RepID=A0A291RGC5_9NOCA|nr:MaoC family dehydratase N-terminal domain-containing protein [Nocardia terpenica]ATL66417.1 hypothetical protein CRH09_09560 [Nocardia terpenica]